MTTQFELEQRIMQCWNVVEDLNFYIHAEEGMDEDNRQNYLIGLKTIYDVKFEQLFSCFERYIKEKHETKPVVL